MDSTCIRTAFLFVILFDVVVTVLAGYELDHCAISEIENDKKLCMDTYGDFGKGNDMEFCENVECFLQCMSDAVGNCASNELLYREDINVLKVTYRAKCADPELTRLAESVCKVEAPCTENSLTKDQFMAANNITSSVEAKPSMDKILQCKLNEAKVTCISVPQTSECKPQMARLVGGIAVVQHSLQGCGIPQRHYLFHVYNEPIQCKNPKIDSRCFTPALVTRMSMCPRVSMFHVLKSPLLGPGSICDNVECVSKCFEDAIGDCYKMDKFILMDPETIKVSLRVTCGNYEDLKEALKRCKMIDTKCYEDLEGELLHAYEHLILKKKYAAYKTTICRESGIFRTCIKYQYSDTCPKLDSSLLLSVYRSWHSYSLCDPRKDYVYQRYKGDTQCKNSTNDRLYVTKEILFVCFSALYIYFMSF